MILNFSTEFCFSKGNVKYSKPCLWFGCITQLKQSDFFFNINSKYTETIIGHNFRLY